MSARPAVGSDRTTLGSVRGGVVGAIKGVVDGNERARAGGPGKKGDGESPADAE